MSVYRRLTLILCSSILSLSTSTLVSAPAEKPVAITILHVNDLHGHIEKNDDGTGGASGIAGFVDQVRADVGATNVVLLDAGDLMQGQPISDLLEGASTIGVWNTLGCQAAAIGNHEFDWGQATLAARATESNFPWLAANIVVAGSNEHPAWARPWAVIKVGAARIGIIGLAFSGTPDIVRKELTDGLVFQDHVSAVLRYYDTVKERSDAVILLGHLPWEDYGASMGANSIVRELAAANRRIDLIIGGHSHEKTDTPHMAGDTPYVIAGCHGRWIGRADVVVDRHAKKLTLLDWRLHAIKGGMGPSNRAVELKVAEYKAESERAADRVIGVTSVSLARNMEGESNLGNLYADAMREYTDADVSFINPGSFSADIELISGEEKHNITWRDTHRAMPYPVRLYEMSLSGAQIMEILNLSATLQSGMIQSSGITWSFHNDCDCPMPVVWGAQDVSVGGKPLESDMLYRVTTTDYLAEGREGWTTFADGVDRGRIHIMLSEVVNDYIIAHSPIAPAIEGRVRRLVK
jgi:5'-nucleotidase/UDP-sugar diphosphatase